MARLRLTIFTLIDMVTLFEMIRFKTGILEEQRPSKGADSVALVACISNLHFSQND